jgi:hypothetical protein
MIAFFSMDFYLSEVRESVVVSRRIVLLRPVVLWGHPLALLNGARLFVAPRHSIPIEPRWRFRRVL